MAERTAIVTGSSSGIGEAAARRLGDDGWKLLLVARREERLETRARSLPDASALAVDLTDADAPERVRAAVEERLGGRLDLLVNNAGGSWRAAFGDDKREEAIAKLSGGGGSLAKQQVDIESIVIPPRKMRELFDGEEEKEDKIKDIPAEMLEEVNVHRERLVEQVVETDDLLMEKWLEGTEITIDDLKGALRRATLTSTLVPILCGSSLKNSRAASTVIPST